jgi:hypothetical protein
MVGSRRRPGGNESGEKAGYEEQGSDRTSVGALGGQKRAFVDTMRARPRVTLGSGRWLVSWRPNRDEIKQAAKRKTSQANVSERAEEVRY